MRILWTDWYFCSWWPFVEKKKVYHVATIIWPKGEKDAKQIEEELEHLGEN